LNVAEEDRRAFFRPLWIWLKRPTVLPVFLFILLFKLGDASMAPMIKPFWLDRGLSPQEIGLISTTLGVGATVLGAMVGGIWVMRVGVFHGLWTLGLLQALSNLGYAAAAGFALGRWSIYGASMIESFTGGMGTAAFLSFLMNVCDAEHAAVQYALLSAIFGFSRSVAGGFSGWGTEHLGFANYFIVTFFLSFPAFALLPWVRQWVRGTGAVDQGT
jgi:PAT family beta-lactamase induction signal transducer AmpG